MPTPDFHRGLKFSAWLQNTIRLYIANLFSLKWIRNLVDTYLLINNSPCFMVYYTDFVTYVIIFTSRTWLLHHWGFDRLEKKIRWRNIRLCTKHGKPIKLMCLLCLDSVIYSSSLHTGDKLNLVISHSHIRSTIIADSRHLWYNYWNVFKSSWPCTCESENLVPIGSTPTS